MRIDSRPESEIEIDLPPFCADVAKTMGGQISPQRIEDVIKLSNQQGYIAHGIKRSHSIPLVLAEGIKPLTPECGNVSFWTSGLRIFTRVVSDPTNDFKYFDTTFFHYAHSTNTVSNERAMAIALTNKSALENMGQPKGKILPNSTIMIDKIIPPEALHLLVVKQGFGTIQGLQTAMFETLESLLKNGFRPNSSTIRSI